jgi:hypothetical protein
MEIAQLDAAICMFAASVMVAIFEDLRFLNGLVVRLRHGDRLLE